MFRAIDFLNIAGGRNLLRNNLTVLEFRRSRRFGVADSQFNSLALEF
jgi:hypothetical protein